MIQVPLTAIAAELPEPLGQTIIRAESYVEGALGFKEVTQPFGDDSWTGQGLTMGGCEKACVSVGAARTDAPLFDHEDRSSSPGRVVGNGDPDHSSPDNDHIHALSIHGTFLFSFKMV
jgi:hypothetical protein